MTNKPVATSDLAKGSPERFGYSWDLYSDLLPAHEEQFLRWTALPKSAWQGSRFLDGDCGIGRNFYWPMVYGATGGVAIDVDNRTLRRARENLAQFPSRGGATPKHPRSRKKTSSTSSSVSASYIISATPMLP